MVGFAPSAALAGDMPRRPCSLAAAERAAILNTSGGTWRQTRGGGRRCRAVVSDERGAGARTASAGAKRDGAVGTVNLVAPALPGAASLMPASRYGGDRRQRQRPRQCSGDVAAYCPTEIDRQNGAYDADCNVCGSCG